MDNNKSYLKGIFSGKRSVMILCAFLCYGILPKLISSLILQYGQKAVPGAVITLVNVVVAAVSLILMMIGLKGLSGKNGRKMLQTLIEAGCFALAVYGLFSVVYIFCEKIVFSKLFTNPVLTYFIYGGLYLLVFLVSSFVVALFFVILSDDGTKRIKKTAKLYVFGLLFMLAFVAAFFVAGGVIQLWRSFQMRAQTSYAYYMMTYILQTVVYYIILTPFIVLLYDKSLGKNKKKPEETSEENAGTPTEEVNDEITEEALAETTDEAADNTFDKTVDETVKTDNSTPVKTSSMKVAGIIASFAVFAASYIVCSLFSAGTSNPDAVMSNLSTLVNYAQVNVALGDYMGARNQVNALLARTLAWQGYIENNPTDINDARRLCPSDQMTEYIEACYKAQNNDFSLLEKGCRLYPYESEWMFSVLYYYKDYEKQGNVLNEKQKALRNELKLILITEDTYSTDMVILGALKKNEIKKIADSLDSYEKAAVNLMEGCIGASLASHNGITADSAREVLAIAKAHPESMLLQRWGYLIGSAYTEDGTADIVSDTITCAKRFDELFEAYVKEQASTKEPVGDTEYINEKLEIASIYISMSSYEDCIVLLRDATKVTDNVNFYKLIAMAYENMGESETSINYAKTALEKSPDSAELMYSIAMNLYREGKVEEAFEYAGELSKLVLESENTPEDSVFLYSFVTMIVCGDVEMGNTSGTYGKITENQFKVLDNYYFLRSLLDATYRYYTFVTLSEDEVKEALIVLDGLEGINNRIPCLYYLEGCYKFYLGDYEGAVSDLTTSLELMDDQPFVWYSLAVVYDKYEQYEKSLYACEKVLELQPAISHLNDPYGVSLHTTRLRESLKQELGMN